MLVWGWCRKYAIMSRMLPRNCHNSSVTKSVKTLFLNEDIILKYLHSIARLVSLYYCLETADRYGKYLSS